MSNTNTKSRFGGLAMVLVLVTSVLAGMPMAVSADELEEPEYMLEVDVDDDDANMIDFWASESIDGGTVDVYIQGYGDDVHSLGHITAEVDDEGEAITFHESDIEAEASDDEEYDLTEEEAEEASFNDYDEIVVSANDDHTAYMEDLILITSPDNGEEDEYETEEVVVELEEDEDAGNVEEAYLEVDGDGDGITDILVFIGDTNVEIIEEAEFDDGYLYVELDDGDRDLLSDEGELMFFIEGDDEAAFDQIESSGFVFETLSGGGGGGDAVSEIGEEVVMAVVVSLLAAGILGVIAARD